MSDMQPKTATHAAEGGHWYDEHAGQILEVPKADGSGMTKCTLRQARKCRIDGELRENWLAPGVTTIIGMADKPGLTTWKVNQGIMAALTLPRLDGETDAAFLGRIVKDSKEQAEKAAEEGSRIHAAVQSHIQTGETPPAYAMTVQAVMRILYALGGTWESEIPCVSRVGVGTKVDLFSRNGWLIDIKGKEGDQEKLNSERTYDEHAMQLAAGARLLLDSHADVPVEPARFGILFVSRDYPGAATLCEVPRAKVEKGWAMFRHLLGYWQIKNDYRPYWATETV